MKGKELIMFKRLNSRTLSLISNISLLIFLSLLLYWRYQLGLVRYFDIDEFAHMHWAYNFFSGMRPYKDFLYFFPPGFLFFLYPLFAIAGTGAGILTSGRILMFLTFLLLLVALFLLVRLVRNTHAALLTLVILAFLPIPYDKFLEIRPDTLAAALAVGGMYFIVKWLNGLMAKWLFLSGLLYGLAIVVSPKVVFFLIAGGMVIVLEILQYRSPKLPRILRTIGIFIGGLAIPAMGSLLFFLWSGEFAKAMYLTTVFASESSKALGAKFYMFPSHFFHPNDTYYAEGGISVPLVVNLIIYLIGVVWGIKSFLSFLDRQTWRESLVELFVSLTFLVNIIAFIKFFPLKHAQYWIAIAPFIAFYSADLLSYIAGSSFAKASEDKPASFTPRSPLRLGEVGRHPLRLIIQIIIYLLFLFFFAWKGYTMYQTKSAWTNQKTLEELAAIQRIIPAGSYVWDLYGHTLGYKDPYYVCCIPYGQYEEAFGFSLPSLGRRLEETNTRYVFAHNEGRLSVLPGRDAEYVKSHFVPINGDPLILMKKD